MIGYIQAALEARVPISVEIGSAEYCALFSLPVRRFALTSERFQLYSDKFSTSVLPPMKMSVDEILDSPREIKFSENIEELNETYAIGKARDFRFPPVVDVDIVCYRSGRDLFFRGSFHGRFEGSCSRCLKDFFMPFHREFEFVLSPDSVGPAGSTEEVRREELGLSYYSGDEINLAPLISEQVMLSLPTRALCAENCRGLCGGCGVDLNYEQCQCSRPAEDPRMAFFRNFRIDR